MSEFVEAVNEAKDKFEKSLPEMLREAGRNHPGVQLFSRFEQACEDVRYKDAYVLGDGCIVVKSEGYNYDGSHEGSSSRTMSYEKFIKECSLDDLMEVGEVLKRLGYV